MQLEKDGLKKEYLNSSSGCLMEKCPVCGREFACNKSYHVYKAFCGRRRRYYCSYSCFKQKE